MRRCRRFTTNRVPAGYRALRGGEVCSTWAKTQTTTPDYRLSKFTFTGQYSYMDDPTTQGVEEGFKLLYYGARWYDPALGRFSQADSIIPGAGDSQAWDRFAYVKNSPVTFNDPTGHYAECGTQAGLGCGGGNGSGGDGAGDDDWDAGEGGVHGEIIYDDEGGNPVTFDPKICGPYGHDGKLCVGGEGMCYTWSELYKMLTAVSLEPDLADVFGLIVNYGRPAWRQLKGGFSLSPVGEGLIGAALQALADAQNPYFSPRQRVMRAGYIGVENGMTDIYSEAIGIGVGAPVGALIAGGTWEGGTVGIGTPAVPFVATGGALAGKVIVSLAMNWQAEEAWKYLNRTIIFPRFNLGLP